MLSLADVFSVHRVMVILRGMSSPGDAVAAAHRAWDAGVELVEVPIGQPGDTEVLKAVVDAGLSGARLSAPGPSSPPTAFTRHRGAGAQYTVAPGFDARIMAQSHALGMPHLPGVATPSEVQQAWAAGVRWVKVFPASTLGPQWFSAIRGPFPDVHYLATGGVNLSNALGYIDAGARIVAFGASAASPRRVSELAELVGTLRARG